MSEKIQLNSEQIEAVNTIKGNLLILASAGTGKTTTIVERYVNLVENHKINPEEIMMTTFTNKAAKDMIEKIKKKTKKLPAYIGTMHSLFLRILRENYDKLPIKPNFTLLTEENDKNKIIKQILEKKRIELTNNNVSYFANRIKIFKNRGISHDDLEENPDLDDKEIDFEEEIEGGEFVHVNSKIKKLSNYVYKEYQRILKESNMLDFDDILLFTYSLLSKEEKIREFYMKNLKSIMVDEAQDLNVVQRNILELLQNDNLCIIGDDCQNIYTWRGASNELIFNFDKAHKKIVLKDNYRSTKTLIENINRIIGSLASKIDKNLQCTREEGNKIKIKEFYNFEEETSFIADEAKRLLRKKESAGDIAVLFRTNNLGKQIERVFRKNKIPCHLSRSKGFFDREGIRDVLAFLRLKSNPSSVLEFERVLNLVGGVGKSKIEKLKEISEKNKIPIRESLSCLNLLNANPQIKENLAKLNILLKDEKQNPIESFLRFFNYKHNLDKKYNLDPNKIEDKQENINILIELFKEYNPTLKGISDFLDSLIEIGKKEKDKGKVILSTIHSAKGLEWKHVYLAGCNETILPFYKNDLSSIKRDDELRLFYVAVSRAKDFLTITYSLTSNWRDLEPSQFLEIIEGDFEDERE